MTTNQNSETAYLYRPSGGIDSRPRSHVIHWHRALGPLANCHTRWREIRSRPSGRYVAGVASLRARMSWTWWWSSRLQLDTGRRALIQ